MITKDDYYEIFVSPATNTIAITFFGEWPEDVKKYAYENFMMWGVSFYARKRIPWPVQDGNEYIFTWTNEVDIKADM